MRNRFMTLMPALVPVVSLVSAGLANDDTAITWGVHRSAEVLNRRSIPSCLVSRR